MIVGAGSGLAQSVGPNAPVPNPSGLVGPSVSGGHDPVVRGAPTQTISPATAELTSAQCRSFLADWSAIPESRQKNLQGTRARCEALINPK